MIAVVDKSTSAQFNMVHTQGHHLLRSSQGSHRTHYRGMKYLRRRMVVEVA